MSDISATLEQIAKEKKRLYPTAPVGLNVVWYPRGDRKNPVAALVTATEGPGQIALTVFPKNGQQSCKQGVLHVTHEQHEQRANAQTERSGSWEYVAGTWATYPREHLQLHADHLDRREKQALAIQQEELAKLQSVLDEQEKLKSGKKKPQDYANATA